MKFPAYGRGLWESRLFGARPRVVCLLVGNLWRTPKWLPNEIPRLAVKTDAWHAPTATRYDWRVVIGCTVLAVDVRGPDERDPGPAGWDSWLWLLGDVQKYARDVLRFTPTEEFYDLPDAFAPERCLEMWAWLNSRYVDGPDRPVLVWPTWWPHAETRSHGILDALAAN